MDKLQNPKHQVIQGDSRDMKFIKDESVHLVITSPPYFQLKDYGTENQIGFHQNYETYINHLNLVWAESYRVLHKGCRLCINIGDQFARAVYYGRYKVIPIRTEIIKFCESIGFDYMGAIIWQKVATTNTTGGASIMGSFPHPRNGILKIDYEFILIFKKLGKAPKPTPEQKEQSKMTTEEWNKYFSGHWNFSGAKQENHLAMFPKELPKRLIRMFSFVNETVLDPFLGSGTTSLAAQQLHRNSIGYEINPDFIPIIKEKLSLNENSIFEKPKVEFLTQDFNNFNFEEKIKEQPYIFKDFLRLDKKIDVKKLQFGSKIDAKSKTEKETLYSIKEIISPEIIALDNDLKIRLIGIKTNENEKEQAIQFLREKTKGKKVFLKFDEVKYDENNMLCAYLYLKNKTFLNRHLIKNNLVFVNEKIDFKYKTKFLKLKKEINAENQNH